MSVIDNLITDRTQSDVSRWSQLKAKTLSGMTEAEKAEWSAGMKGAYKYTDLNRVNEALVYLQNRLRGYGYLVDVVLPVIEGVEGDPPDEHVLLQLSGTAFEDSSMYERQITNDGASVATMAGSLNESVFYFNGSGKINLPIGDYFNFGSGDFTIEWREYIPAAFTMSGNPFSFDPYPNHFLWHYQTSGIIGLFYTPEYNGTNIGSVETRQWISRAFVRSGNTIYSFRNGVPIWSGSITQNTPYTAGYQMCVGGRSDGQQPFQGYIEEFRVSDIARYTSEYTPATEPFPENKPQTITTRPYWAEGDIPTQAQMEQYLQNISNIRAALEVLQTTPPVPSDMVGLTFGEANDIERILVDVETVINRVVAGFFRSNAFTVICGNRPLPSAQSELGRTWDDIDAEDLTWDDLDDHGSSWYVIQYGVLKGTAVGIL